VYEKPIVTAASAKLLATTFTLPEVEVGDIIEYRYRRRHQPGYVFDSRWILSEDLFTSHAKFSLEPSRDLSLRWSWPRGLPTGTPAPVKQGSRIQLETHDIPAFVTEEYMPPADELRYRVDFIYTLDHYPDTDPVIFWNKYAKQANSRIDDFVGSSKAMQQAVAQIVATGDSPEAKLRRIYARVAQIRNISYERPKTEQEQEREGRTDARRAEDVWKKSAGDARQITWLFLALVRAAGIQAAPALVPTRDLYFFSPLIMNPNQLNSSLVIVQLDGKDLFLDPGVPFTPFGLLPWNETAVRILRLDKDGGGWLDTPLLVPASARIERKAVLKLTSEDVLEGKVTISYSGIEAAWRRLAQRDEDDTERKDYLESLVQDYIPSGIDAKLTNRPDWTGWDTPLVAEYTMSVPGWMAYAGKRGLLPVSVFGRSEEHAFEHASRTQPLYFNFPYQNDDDVTIELPRGWHVDSLPGARTVDHTVLSYNLAAENNNGSLHLTRTVRVDLMFLGVQYYDQLREFFQTVRTGDAQRIVITPGAATASR
jgi:hypothetical protein